jgi:hypothetical protein
MTIMDVIRFEVWAIVGASAALMVYKLVTRRISTSGLLSNGGTAIAATRVQMLVTSAFVAISYLEIVATSHDAWTLPEVPAHLLVLLGGSQAIHLGGKGAALLNWFPYLRGN